LPLQDRLDAFTAEFETRTAPPEVVATLRRSTAELIASREPRGFRCRTRTVKL